MDQRHLREIFDQFDLNGDGSISRNELTVAIRSAGLDINDELVQTALSNADGDSDGGISFTEFVHFLDTFRGRSEPLSHDEADLPRIREIFQAASEINGFDLVNAEDLKSLTAESYGFSVSKEEVSTIEQINKDLLGRNVDFSGFLSLWRSAKLASC